MSPTKPIMGAGPLILKYVGKNTSIYNNKIDKKELLIFPNLSSDFITITLDRWAPPSRWSPSDKVQIFDMLGIEVYTSQTGMSELLKIDISYLPTGVYFIKLGNKVEKFVKM